MQIKDLIKATGMTQKQFGEYLNIPKRTVEDWNRGLRTPPDYVVELIEYKLKNENKI